MYICAEIPAGDLLIGDWRRRNSRKLQVNQVKFIQIPQILNKRLIVFVTNFVAHIFSQFRPMKGWHGHVQSSQLLTSFVIARQLSRCSASRPRDCILKFENERHLSGGAGYAHLPDSCLLVLQKQRFFSHGPGAPFFIHTDWDTPTQCNQPHALNCFELMRARSCGTRKGGLGSETSCVSAGYKCRPSETHEWHVLEMPPAVQSGLDVRCSVWIGSEVFSLDWI